MEQSLLLCLLRSVLYKDFVRDAGAARLVQYSIIDRDHTILIIKQYTGGYVIWLDHTQSFLAPSIEECYCLAAFYIINEEAECTSKKV